VNRAPQLDAARYEIEAARGVLLMVAAGVEAGSITPSAPLDPAALFAALAGACRSLDRAAASLDPTR
jgi:hypothetical protein